MTRLACSLVPRLPRLLYITWIPLTNLSSLTTTSLSPLSSSRIPKYGNTRWESSSFVLGQPALITLISSWRLSSFAVCCLISWRVDGFRHASCIMLMLSTSEAIDYRRREDMPGSVCHQGTWWTPSYGQGWSSKLELLGACAGASLVLGGVVSERSLPMVSDPIPQLLEGVEFLQSITNCKELFLDPRIVSFGIRQHVACMCNGVAVL